MGRSSDIRANLRTMKGPGPAYMLPPTVGYIGHDGTRVRYPAYSLGLYGKSSLGANARSPGPIYLVQKGLTAKGPDGQPAYSLGLKGKGAEFFSCSPGPVYLPNINVNRPRAPTQPMSWRTRYMDKVRSPGPVYLLPPCLGPKIPDKAAAGEASLKGRGRPIGKLSQSPGPIYHIGSPCVVKPCLGGVSLKGRWKELKSQSSAAGPGSYNVLSAARKVYPQQPAFSLGIRHSEFAGTLMTECDKSANAGTDDTCC